MKKFPALLAALLLLGRLLLAGHLGAEVIRLTAAEAQSFGAREADALFIEAGAEFEQQDRALVLKTGLFSFYPAQAKPLRPAVVYPMVVDRGDALGGAVLSREALEYLEAELRDGRGASLVKARGFALARGGREWSFLLGVPSTLEAGSYTLTLRGGRQDGRFFLHIGTIRVLPKSFLFEQIAFNQALTQLAVQPDPRKEEEFLRLRKVLADFDPGALWHWGRLLVPVADGRVTSRFSDHRLYRYTDGGSSQSMHNGIDLAAPEGTPVLACGSGRVVLAAERVMTGKSLVIEHLPGVYSLYFHLAGIEVAEQEVVRQGQRIGTVGMSGLATGPHLHWELRVGGVAVNPEAQLEKPFIDKEYFSEILRELRLQDRR